MNNGVPYQVVPRAAAESLVRAMREEESAWQGQQAGVPGQGPEPGLVHTPGGRLIDDALHPAFTIFEQLYRVLPEEGWFSPAVSPRSPIQFELGSFTVPADLTLWLFDYEFTVYRPSGVDPGDFVEAAAGRFSNVMGFDVNMGGRRESQLSYQLDPRAVTAARSAFEAPITGGGGAFAPAPAAAFNRAAVNSFASTASPGTSLLPVRPEVQGPRTGPFTLIAGQGSTVALSCVIFNTVPAPIAAIQGRQAGYLVNQNLSQSLLNRIRPR